jgi:hypothetical protein
VRRASPPLESTPAARKQPGDDAHPPLSQCALLSLRTHSRRGRRRASRAPSSARNGRRRGARCEVVRMCRRSCFAKFRCPSRAHDLSIRCHKGLILRAGTEMLLYMRINIQIRVHKIAQKGTESNSPTSDTVSATLAAQASTPLLVCACGRLCETRTAYCSPSPHTPLTALFTRRLHIGSIIHRFITSSRAPHSTRHPSLQHHFAILSGFA